MSVPNERSERDQQALAKSMHTKYSQKQKHLNSEFKSQSNAQALETDTNVNTLSQKSSESLGVYSDAHAEIYNYAHKFKYANIEQEED